MHIADGYLSHSACIVTTGLAAASLGWAVAKVRTTTTSAQWKLAPAAAAAVFTGHMVNVALGTEMSGHLVGSALMAILLGPALAMIVMAGILTSQCLFLADGGITALGANFLSMGVIGVIAASGVWSFLRRNHADLSAAGTAAWASVVAGALACTASLASGDMILPMLAHHSLIGIAEAGATAALLAVLHARSTIHGKNLLLLLAAAALLIVWPFASTLPDGLEAALNKNTGWSYVGGGLLAALPLLLFAARRCRAITRTVRTRGTA